MKIFIDTANIEQIKEVNSWGILDGVTTNPSLVAKEGKDFSQIVKEICAVVDGPISVEAVSTKAVDIVPEGKKLAAINPNIVVKVPMNEEGLKATKMLAAEGIRVNVTLIFSANQALLAAKAGARLRLSVRRSPGRHRAERHGAHRGDHGHLRELRVRHRDHRGQRPRPHPCHRGRANGSRCSHHPL